MSELSNEKSHIRCKIIIEVLGKPKEHIEKAIRDYVDKISKDDELILLKSEFSEAEEKEDGLFAVFVDIEIVIKGLHKLVAFCFDYMPSSVDIIKPEEFDLKAGAIEDFINNLQARLHQVDMIVKNLRNENTFMKKNMHTAVKNIILLSLAYGPKPKEELTKATGIHDKELELFLKQLESENQITNDNGMYVVSKKEDDASKTS